MRTHFRRIVAVAIALTAFAATQLPSLAEPPRPTTRTSLFDPDRHLRVADVKRGMTGYGLTVFHGTTIERFDVEVIDVIRNFAPGSDAILILAKGDYLKHVGGVAGMSGSPIYLLCDDGKYRLAGAFAFGWRLAKDPVAGVQPVEYMLELADPDHPRPPAVPPRPGTPPAPAAAARSAFWRYADHLPPPTLPVDQRVSWFLARHLPQDRKSAPLAHSGISLVASGIAPGTLDTLRPLLAAAGLGQLRSAAAASAPDPPPPDPVLEPGSSLVIPLLTGDLELSALGTCTEVIDGRVFGFGHPFNAEGAVELNMGAGYVSGIIATLENSFKIGGLTRPLGVLRADTAVGVGGRLGGSVPTTAISVRLRYPDGSIDRTLKFQAAKHPNFTPLLALLSTLSALQLEHAPPADHTLELNARITFPDGHQLVLADRFEGSEPLNLISALAMPLMVLSDSPFGRIFPDTVDTTLTITPGRHAATILSASLVRPRARPGETLSVLTTLRQPDGTTRQLTVPFDLPPDLEPGDYDLQICDAPQFLSKEIEHQPGRFFARSNTDLLEVLMLAGTTRADQLYLRLTRGPDGLAVGRTSLRRLPASLGQLLTSNPDTTGLPATPTQRALTRIVPAQLVLSGSTSVRITIEAEPGRKPRPTHAPTTQP